jgi:hypothetical protein
MGAQSPLVMPAKAGIQPPLLDSRQKHAGMTARTAALYPVDLSTL